MTGYAFGYTELAVRRLQLVAEVFGESSSAFMREAIDYRPRLAVDLGCGPGHTTHLVIRTLCPEHTVGLENSESFLDYARTTGSEGVSFLQHDITKIPFPTGPAEVIFGRLVLTHLVDPEVVVHLWGSQLSVGGRLLMQEVEHIVTANPVLASCLDMQQAMLKEQGNALYIGPRLDAIGDSVTLKRKASKVRTLEVPEPRAASMFLMNFRVWRHNEFVQRNYSAESLDELETQLSAIAGGPTGATTVEWGLCEIVMERVD